MRNRDVVVIESHRRDIRQQEPAEIVPEHPALGEQPLIQGERPLRIPGLHEVLRQQRQGQNHCEDGAQPAQYGDLQQPGCPAGHTEPEQDQLRDRSQQRQQQPALLGIGRHCRPQQHHKQGP